MIYYFAEAVINFFERYGEVEKSNREILIFGIVQSIRMLLNFATVILIGIMMDSFWQGIIFMIAFIPLRSYAGGFHASTPLRCYAFSIILIIGILQAIKITEGSTIVPCILLVVAAISILFLSPMASVNKPLTELQNVTYRKKSIFVLGIYLCLIVLFSFWKLEVSYGIGAAVVASGGLLLVEYIKKLFLQEEGIDSVINLNLIRNGKDEI